MLYRLTAASIFRVQKEAEKKKMTQEREAKDWVTLQLP
jgi:hypothetical protein